MNPDAERRLRKFMNDTQLVCQAPTPQPLGNPAESKESVRTRPDAARGGVAASLSHYVPRFTANVGPLQQAACGAYVNTRTEHADEPTCPACAAYLVAAAAEEVEARR